MKNKIFLGACALVAVALAAPAGAQSYPAKPVRFILPFPPGGPTDILGRIIGQRLAVQLNQPVVPENRPGAGGNVGTEFAAKQPADGYAIVLASPSLSISPGLYKKLGYDPVKDFAPITLVAQIPNVLLVHPSVPVKTLKEFVQLAKAHPGKLNFGSGGLGTSNHLGSEMLKGLTGINMVHVPYKGSNEAMIGMIGGHVDMVVIGVPPTLPHIKAGRVRPLAVLAAERLPYLPDVPTSKEAGVANYEVITSYGILAPTGTPREVIERVQRDSAKILLSEDFRGKLAQQGMVPVANTPGEFAAAIRDESTRWARVVKERGLTAN